MIGRTRSLISWNNRNVQKHGSQVSEQCTTSWSFRRSESGSNRGSMHPAISQQQVWTRRPRRRTNLVLQSGWGALRKQLKPVNKLPVDEHNPHAPCGKNTTADGGTDAVGLVPERRNSQFVTKEFRAGITVLWSNAAERCRYPYDRFLTMLSY